MHTEIYWIHFEIGLTFYLVLFSPFETEGSWVQAKALAKILISCPQKNPFFLFIYNLSFIFMINPKGEQQYELLKSKGVVTCSNCLLILILLSLMNWFDYNALPDSMTIFSNSLQCFPSVFYSVYL